MDSVLHSTEDRFKPLHHQQTSSCITTYFLFCLSPGLWSGEERKIFPLM